jgi:hypothetical protein
MAITKNISELPILRHYDKLLVVGALVVLLVSLAYLISAMASEKDLVKEWEDKLNNLKPTPAAAEVAPINMDIYGQGEKELGSPFVLSPIIRTNANFLAPEVRVACTNDVCLKLVSIKAQECPFCSIRLPDFTKVPPRLPTVGKVPDDIKRHFKLPINDIEVENQDIHGDGFTLLEKWFWLGRDDLLKVPPLRPPYSMKLVVKEFKGKPLPMRFTGYIPLPEPNTMQLMFYWAGRNPRAQEFRVKWLVDEKQQGPQSQPIEKKITEKEKDDTGYSVVSFEKKTEEQDTPAGRRRVDVSTVMLKRNSDGKEIELRIEEKEKNTDVEAILTFLVDNSELKLLEKQEFKLRDETYRVVSINEKDTTVLVEGVGTDHKETVSTTPKEFKNEP